MCGLTGIYDLKSKRSPAKNRGVCVAMNDRLVHRGPDKGDIWQTRDGLLSLGHRRLSILDLSPSGAQPMASASKRYVIVYNGEIYNTVPLRRDLQASHDIQFRGHSDTEIILAAIDVWGLDTALAKINGMFAFVLWDAQEKRLHCVRDRLGKKPLYVGWAGDSLVFASELKAIRAHPEFVPQINKEALSLYMRYAHIPAPHSIYDGVWHVPPGHMMSLSPHTLTAGMDVRPLMEPYWQAGHVAENSGNRPFTGTEAQAVKQLEDLLGTCTKDRMVSDVPLGAFLSGGIDSSAVVAMMQKHSDTRVKTYSIGFDEAGFDEAVYARKVAKHIGTEHHEFYVTQKDALNIIPSLPDMYDEPFADISALPTSLVSQFASKDVTVALSGDGGDEMLGGYNRHISAPRVWGACSWLPQSVRKVTGNAMAGVSIEAWDKALAFKPQAGTAVHKLAGLIKQGSEQGVYDHLITHWDTPPVTQNYPAMDWKRDERLSFSEQMMLWDTQSYLPNGILAKVDRASMASSLEVRAPLLDTRIFDFAWGLDLKYKIRGGTGKWLLREMLKKHVPSELFERPKQGFSMPVGQWLREELKGWGGDLLAVDNQCLDMTAIRQVWAEHQDGRGDHATKLWTALMFLAWYQKWM